MKIAIDSGPLTSGHAVRGIGFNTSELISALETQRLGIEKPVVDAFDFSANVRSLNTGRYDIVHKTYFHPFFITTPFRFKGKLIVTVHDLIYLIYPKKYPSGLKGKVRFLIQRMLLKKVDAIITISETSKKDIVRFLGIPPEKIHVIYLAPRKIFKKIKLKNPEKIRKEYDLPKKFILYVGDINFNKNIPTLIKAAKLAGIALVIVGKQATEIEDQETDLVSLKGPKDWIRFLFNIPHPEKAHYKNILKEFKSGGKIIRTGFISDEDLVEIYNLASIYCMPSFYEGFGLSILEAMACGVPVVAGKTQALVEIGGSACVYADPKKPGEFAGIFKKLLSDKDLSKKYVEKGFEHVKKFSWEKCAKETMGVYQKVFKNSVK